MRLGVLAALLVAGCANDNIAELAARVRIVDDPAAVQGCRPVGPVVGDGTITSTARKQAMRRTLYLGGDVLVVNSVGEQRPTVVWTGTHGSSDPYAYHTTFKGYAFACAPDGPLSRQLVGTTFVPPGQITVAADEPSGCDEAGETIDAYTDGPPGSTEDGLRRRAALVLANYVRVLKRIHFDGRPAVRAQPYACAVRP